MKEGIVFNSQYLMCISVLNHFLTLHCACITSFCSCLAKITENLFARVYFKPDFVTDNVIIKLTRSAVLIRCSVHSISSWN